MGKKKKRRKRKRRPPAPAPVAQPEATSEVAEEPAPEMGSAPERSADRPRRGLFGGAGIPSPYPSLGASLAGGAAPVGASPVVLGAAFLFVVGLWAAFFAPRGIGSASLLSVVASLPPVSLLSDGLILLQDPAGGAVRPFVSVLGIMAVRAVGLGLIAGLVVNVVRGGDPDLRGVLARLPRWSLRLFAVLSAQLGLVLGAFILGQALLGVQFAVLFVWIMGLYFLIFAPVILVAEDVSAAEVLRRSVRAARLPGMRHLSLVLAYFAFIFWVSTAALEPGIPPATPSFLSWLVILGSTFLHVAALGVVTFRWFAVRDEVPAGPAERRRR